MSFSENLWLLLKLAKSSKVALQGHWKKDSQNVRKLGVFLEEMDGAFWQKKSYFSKNW